MQFPQGAAAVPLHTAKQQFAHYLAKTPGARRDHMANLMSAGAEQLRHAAVSGLVGAMPGALFGGMASGHDAHVAVGGFAVGGMLGAGAILVNAKNYVRDARTNTIQAGVRAGALSQETVDSWAKSGLTQHVDHLVAPMTHQELEAHVP